MADKRMFSKSIIDSDAFLDMPLSSQALYFHLSMRADDEGFVNNPKKIQRVIGASDDDLKLLAVKSFIIPFESGVVVIKHWKIHNYIRADRLKPTNYEDERSQLTVKKNGSYTLCQSDVGQLSDKCQSDDGIDKNSIDKNSIGKDSIDICQQVVDMYHEECPSLPKVRSLSDTRKKHINARLKEHSMDELRLAFQKAEASDWCTGRSGDWKCNLEWMMKSENNLLKILEGNYDNRNSIKEKTISDMRKITEGMTAEEYAEMEKEFR